MASELLHLRRRSGPAIWAVGRCLYARTRFWLRLLTLFSHDRLVSIDRDTRLVTVRRRWLWGFREETTVPFSAVDYVDQDYVESFMSDDVQQTYAVKLVLADYNGKLELFRFSGYYDERSSPQQAAIAFQSVVADALGVPASPPVVHRVSKDGMMLLCVRCDRRCGPGALHCFYCGGELQAVAVEEDPRSSGS